MELVSVKVENFKSIEDSEEFSIEQVTCLVGKNESGKSALLQALYKLNPENDEDRRFDDVQEYPRRRLTEYQKQRRLNPNLPAANVLTTIWELSSDDISAVEGLLGPGVFERSSDTAPVTTTVTKGYDNISRWVIRLDEKKIVDHFVKPAQLSADELAELKVFTSIEALMDYLEELPAPSERQETLLTALQQVFPKKSAVNSAISTLSPRMPKFVYFTNYHRMPGAVSLEQLKKNIENEKAKPLSFSDRIFLALLALAGATKEDVTEAGRFEQYIANIEAVSNSLTEQIFEYWTQNQHLEVKFVYSPGLAEDPSPFNEGNVFRIRILNTRHKASVSFDERSAGFVWFFSFLTWFSQLQEIYHENLILLLDEPGLSLHGKAQEDLVRYFNEKLRPYYQVIYTTHSPWMIDADYPLSIRTVEDVVVPEVREQDGSLLEPAKLLGTKVGDKVWSRDPDTVFPLQGKLGWGLSQFLFVGRHNLVVEGPSEILYLKWFSAELKRRNRTSLDIRWVLVPCEGVDKISPFISLFSGNRLHMAVVVDYHHEVKGRVRSIEESKLLEQGHVFRLDKYAGKAEADIEDMIGRGNYIGLVNACYGLTKADVLPKTKPADSPDRVVKEVEQHFRMRPTLPEFDHYDPALYLMENGVSLNNELAKLDEAIDRFEALFIDINKLLD